MDGRSSGQPGGQGKDPQRQRSQAAENLKTAAGLRLIAALEAAKGCLVLAVGVGLHHFAHHDVGHLALRLVHQFHLNPASHYPGVFVRWADHVTDTRLQMLALGALGYAALRFVEAYGLWRSRRWAEWFAAVAAGVYIPFELYHIWLHATALKLALLAFNVVVVAYLARVLWRKPAGSPERE